MRSLAVVLLVIWFLEPVPRMGAQVSREVAAKALPSVVVVTARDQDGQPLAIGSGFFVEDRVVASNLHVINRASRGSITLPGNRRELVIESVIGVDEVNDLVLLIVAATNVPPLKLGDSKAVVVGDEACAIGSPE